jgi:hypothetical protein
MALDRLKSWLLLTLTVTVGALLGTGWLLTWARLHSERLPSEGILAALPHSYFVNLALQTAFPSLIMTLVLGGAWVTLSLRRRRTTQHPYSPTAWALFGVVLVLAFWLPGVVLSSGGSRDKLGYLFWESVASSACVLLALLAGLIDRALPLPRNPFGATDESSESKAQSLKPARRSAAVLGPLITMTVILSVATAGVLRIADAYLAKGVLPIGQAVLNHACSDVSGGRSAADPPDGAEKPCVVGGFYLGESGTWIYLVQRESPCPHRRHLQPQLVSLKVADVQELLVLGHLGCPKRRPACPLCAG